MSKSLLIIFAKNPLPGKVKTRIAKELGNELTLDIYIKLMEITEKNVGGLSIDKWVAYSDFIEHQDLWHTRKYKKIKQEGSDLGMKMHRAFEQAFAQGYEKVCLIGTDIPSLKEPILKEAFLQLDKVDVVIGPAQDGGYCLMGLKKNNEALFLDKKWSHSNVLKDATATIKTQGLQHVLLKPLKDIDHVKDLRGTGILEAVMDDDWNLLV